jgi:hypothetical protein
LARAHQTRIEALEDAVRAQRSEVTAEQASQQVEAAAPSSPSTTPEDAERSRKERLERWEASLQWHHSQRVDGHFADRAAPALRAALSKIGEQLGFTVSATDCRTQSCEAQIEWTNFEQAARNLRETMVLPEKLSCATDTILPPPADPRAPYTAKILYDQCKLIDESL